MWAWASYAWAQGALGLQATIVINALAISLLHEMVRVGIVDYVCMELYIHKITHCDWTGPRLLLPPYPPTTPTHRSTT